MNIAVIGCGYVGLVAGVCFAEFGFRVYCIDADKEKTDILKKGEVHIYEDGLDEVLQRNIDAQRLSFHNDKECLECCDIIVVAVGTPEGESGATNMTYIDSVIEEVSQLSTGDKYIIVKSTVPIGTARKIMSNLEITQQQKEIKFHLISNPEFLQEGSALHDFMNPDRIIVGCSSQKARDVMRSLYAPLIGRGMQIVFTDNESAELIKYGANSYLAMRIAFINEIADIAEETGANIKDVALGMGLDKRIGAGYLKAGPGYGGSCFPKDTKSLASIAQWKGVPSKLIEGTIRANDERRNRMVEKIISALGDDCAGKKIGILGLAFKANTDDMRDSPSIEIIQGLLQRNIEIQVYDPKAMDEARKIFKDSISYYDNRVDVAKNVDSLVVLTEWEEFKNLDFNLAKKVMRSPVLVDLRNIFIAEDVEKKGFKYVCIGKS